MEKVINQKLKLSRMLPILTALLGIALMIYMITTEGELGALPMILIILGILWFIINRYQIKKSNSI